MRGRDDVAGFIAGFAGDDRYIVDYLVEEVLQRQSDHVRHFLLQTSILDRLSGPLCDAATGRDGGKAMLEALDRGNLFLVPLDDRRQWYRYHQLFADVLQAHLLDEQPDDVPDLHRRASEWYEQNGEPSEAIRHALAAEDFERAADLVELAAPATRQYRQEVTLRRWLEALPEELLQVRPVLSNAYAGSLLVRGEVEGVESHLQAAERWLDPTTGGPPGSLARSPEMVVVDEEGFAPTGIDRCPPCRASPDPRRHGRHHGLRPAGARPRRRGRPPGARRAAALLGLAYWTNGDLDAADRWYTDGMASLEKAGYLSDLVGGAITQADIRIAQGRLREAMSRYERGLQFATQQAGTVLRGAADMHVGIGMVLRERNDLAAAVQHLRTSKELGEPTGLPQNRYRWRVAMAGVREAEGDLDGAVDLLNEAQRVYVSDFSPEVRPIPPCGHGCGFGRAGSVTRSAGCVSGICPLTRTSPTCASSSTSPSPECSWPGTRRSAREVVLQDATRLLERLLRAAEDGKRNGSVLGIVVLQALVHQARGDMRAALASLQRALTLAEPEGYVRLFVDEGPPWPRC